MTKKIPDAKKVEKGFPGYPQYPADEDIFNNMKKEPYEDPEGGRETIPPRPNVWNEKDGSEELTGDDLDVPGSELDDDMEAIGSEDEENDYYSLGGDNHNDLEEDNQDGYDD